MPFAVRIPAAHEAIAPAVRVRDLTVVFTTAQGELPAVSHVSLDLAPGQVTGLVGESGSGKSTLAQALLNAVPKPGRVASGAVEIDGIGVEANVLVNRKVLVKTEALRHIADPILHLLRICGDVDS